MSRLETLGLRFWALGLTLRLVRGGGVGGRRMHILFTMRIQVSCCMTLYRRLVVSYRRQNYNVTYIVNLAVLSATHFMREISWNHFKDLGSS